MIPVLFLAYAESLDVGAGQTNKAGALCKQMFSCPTIMASLADIDSVIGPQRLRSEHGVAMLCLISFLVYVDHFSIQAAIWIC